MRYTQRIPTELHKKLASQLNKTRALLIEASMLYPKQSRVGRALASAENANGNLRSILDDELTDEQFAVVKYYGRHNEAAP